MTRRHVDDGVLVARGFVGEPDVAAMLSVLDLAVRARTAGLDMPGVRVMAVRTEVSCRRVVRQCGQEISNRVTSLRERVVATVKKSFDVSDEWPELTLLSEMRATDCHPLHADAEQQISGGWGPNHTYWRAHVALLYLNTSGADFEGGLLRLPEVGRTITPTAGMLVSFPTGHQYVHEVTRVASGRRLSLAIWLTADPERTEPWMSRAKTVSGGHAGVRTASAGSAPLVGPVGGQRAAEPTDGSVRGV